MSAVVVRTQAELDAALGKSGVDCIEIDSPAGGWITVRASGSATVHAYVSATVHASGSATVHAYDSATVRAYDSATVHAYGSATVRAYGSATVHASPKTAVHLHSGHAKVKGGVLIDHTAKFDTPAEWCDYHGLKVSRAGVATVYKAVNDQWTTDRGFDYSPGSKPSAPDWRDDDGCGGGLHFSPTPHHALAYYPDATRFVAVGVKVADLRPIPGGTAKCKAPRVVRAAVAVDIDGNKVSS